LISLGKVTDAETPATQSTCKNTDPSKGAIPVVGLIFGSSGEVIITEAMILKRLDIDTLPAMAMLTNLDFLKEEAKGEASAGTHQDLNGPRAVIVDKT
jgi:hypothetical protein